jgi:hypothetical protein
VALERNSFPVPIATKSLGPLQVIDYEVGCLLRELRASGWRVAIHNDYDQGGESFTFWLFTHAATGRFVKGEGKTDVDAIRMAFDSKKEGERILDEQPPQDQIFVWTCGCGTVNGVNLATCRVCGRKEGDQT